MNNSFQNTDIYENKIQAASEVSSNQEDIANKVLDDAIKKTANSIRRVSKAAAAVTSDKKAMKSLAETIEALGDATAKVALNSGIIAEEMVEKFGPAFKQWVFAGSDMVQDTLFDAMMAAIGAVPVVGDVISTAGQVLNSANENGFRAYWASILAIPGVIDVVNNFIDKFGDAINGFKDVGQPLTKLANNIGTLAENIEDQGNTPIKGGSGRKKRTRKYNKKKRTKKKARTRRARKIKH